MGDARELFASCTPGLEGALAEELRALGLDRVQPVAGGVEARGDYATVNRGSRIASRVLWRLGSAPNPSALKSVVKLPAPWPVVVEGGDRAWQAAAESAWGGAASKPDESLHLQLRLNRGACVVSVDTSGPLLHFRGYRQEVGRAPMRETLAAGMLRLAKHDPLRPLHDVMCGSGTLLIEAAEAAAGLAPGRNRHFAFEAWPGATPPPVWPAPVPPAAPIIGTDLNAGALGTARRNAKRAGVLDRLTLERADATKLSKRPDLAAGLVVANLPYGKRVGERSELGSLYRALGLSVRRAYPGWRFAFLLEDGADWLGLPITERFSVANGGLRCELVVGTVPA